MPLDKKMTQEETALLVNDLHQMSMLFRDQPMSKDQLREYGSDLTNYFGFTYPFADLRKAIKLARQRFEEPGLVLPKVKFIMDMINPKA